MTGRPPANEIDRCVFLLDLDLDPMTLTYQLELGILKMYSPTTMNVLGQGFQSWSIVDRERDTGGARIFVRGGGGALTGV